MPSAPDGVWLISICYISAHVRCSWRIKSDRFMRSTGSGFRLELRGICLLFAQQRCTRAIVPLASSSRDGRHSFHETPAHAGARQPWVPAQPSHHLSLPVGLSTTLVRVASASGEVRPGRHVCCHREAHAMERMCAAPRDCGRSLVDRPRRLSGGHTRSQIVRGGRSRPSVCGVSLARGALRADTQTA